MFERRSDPYLWVNKTPNSVVLSRCDHQEARSVKKFVQVRRLVSEKQVLRVRQYRPARPVNVRKTFDGIKQRPKQILPRAKSAPHANATLGAHHGLSTESDDEGQLAKAAIEKPHACSLHRSSVTADLADPGNVIINPRATDLTNHQQTVASYRARPIRGLPKVGAIQNSNLTLTALDTAHIDPFSSLPTDLPGHIVTKQMKMTRFTLVDLYPNRATSRVSGCEFASHLLEFALESPSLLHSMVAGTMMYERAARENPNSDKFELVSTHKAVHFLSQQMQKPETAVTEANIWAVFILGACGGLANQRTGKLPKQSTLRKLQSLHVYGRMEVNEAHLSGLGKLIQLIGGFSNIRTPGMAQVLSCSHLLDSSRLLQRPVVPYIPQTNNFRVDDCLKVASKQCQGRLDQPGPGTGFHRAWKNESSEGILPLQQTISYISCFSELIDDWSGMHSGTMSSVDFIDSRNFVHHRLMMLPTAEELASGTDATIDPQYDSCRLACIAYDFLVVFPLPPVVGTYELVSQRLREAIQHSQLNLETMSLPKLKLHLWVLSLGAISSVGLTERDWFIIELASLVQRLGIQTWPEMVRMLNRFLWHSSTNDRDGLDLWTDMLRHSQMSS